MKIFNIVGLVGATALMNIQQAVAVDCLPGTTCGAVPEMDGSGAIIAIGLVVGLAALFRERFFRK